MSERLVDRRALLQSIGLAGAAGVIAGPAFLAGGAGAQSASAPKEPPAVAESPAEGEAKEASAEAKKLGEIAKSRYGQHLSEEQLKLLVEDLDGGLTSGQQLRKLGLQNADEPEFVFRADL